jgi:hypothetical protein
VTGLAPYLIHQAVAVLEKLTLYKVPFAVFSAVLLIMNRQFDASRERFAVRQYKVDRSWIALILNSLGQVRLDSSVNMRVELAHGNARFLA